MLVLDFDHDISLMEALDLIEGVGADFFLYTTHSHQMVTKSHPKPEDCFRIVIPLREPLPSKEFPALFNWANNLFDHKIDPSRSDLCGMFFLPMMNSKSTSAYEMYSKVDKTFLDWKEIRDGLGLTQGDAPLRSAPLRPPATPRTDADDVGSHDKA